MSAPVPVAVFGLLQERFYAWVDPLVNPFSDLDLAFGDDDQLD